MVNPVTLRIASCACPSQNPVNSYVICAEFVHGNKTKIEISHLLYDLVKPFEYSQFPDMTCLELLKHHVGLMTMIINKKIDKSDYHSFFNYYANKFDLDPNAFKASLFAIWPTDCTCIKHTFAKIQSFKVYYYNEFGQKYNVEIINKK